MGLSVEDRNKLRGQGRWKEYVARRESLESMAPKERDATLEREFDVVLRKKKEADEATGSKPVAKSSSAAPAPSGLRAPEGAGLILLTDEELRQIQEKGLGDDPRNDVNWVLSNVSVSGVKPGDAPSTRAWGLLQEVKSDTDFRRDFYKAVWLRLLPTKSAADEDAEKMSDDGAAIELIDKIASGMKTEVK